MTLRVGIISVDDADALATRQEHEELGVKVIRVDRVRSFGRAAQQHAPEMNELCGRCGTHQAAISPTGEVSPYVMSG